MNWDAIGAIGEVIGALGVIVSLLYLSVQIRRSDQTARVESIQSVLDGYRDRSIVPYFSNPQVMDLFAKGLTDFERLSENEKRQFVYLFAENVFQMQQTMELHQHGLLPQVDYDAWIYYVATLIRTPGGTAVWPYIEATITPTIRDLMNTYLDAHPETPSYLELNPLMKHSGSPAA